MTYSFASKLPQPWGLVRPLLQRRRLVRVVATALVALTGSAAADAQTASYTFRKIADSAQLTSVAGASCVGVNALSTVVLTAADGSVWVGRGNGAPLLQVSGPTASGQPLAIPCVGLNDRDEIVNGFSYTSPAYTALLKSSAGVLTQLARSDTAPFLNENGDTAIHSLTNGGTSLFKALDGRLYLAPSGAAVYPQGPTDSLLSSVLAGTMNDNAVVAFYAMRQAGGVPRGGIYRSSAVPLVEDGNAVVDLVTAAHPAINSSGVVAFLGSLHDGRDHLLTTSDGVNFVDHSVSIGTSISQLFSINDSGSVVFAARLAGNTGFGVFTGPDAMANRVIAPGDTLDGSTVVTATVWPEALNGNGQVSFLAQLADGRWGVYRADPTSMPSASNGTLSVGENTPGNGTLVASDPANRPLTFAIQSNGAKGTATITNAATGAYTYTPTTNAIGADSFTFWVSNGTQTSNVATVSVTITAPPSGNHAPVAVSVGTPLGAVRFDDAADELRRTTNLPPIGGFTMMGWFKVMGDGHAYSTFLGLGDTSSSNAYVVQMCCGNGWRQLEVWTGASSAMGPNLALNTWYHLALTVAGSGAGQVNAYLNGALALTLSGNASVSSLRFSIGNDAHGEWLDGSAASVKVYDAVLTQAEIASEMGQATPVRTANLNSWYPLASAATAMSDASVNGRTLTLAGTLLDDVAGPPIPAITPYVTPEDTSISGTLQASDQDGNPLTFSIVTSGAKGTVSVTNPSTGAFIYTPAPNANGPDSFTFKANDGLVDSNIATVVVAVTPVNDPPVASNGTASVLAGSTVTGTIIATDIDSPTLTYALVLNGAKGVATVNPTTGAYTYTANQNASGTDTFQVKANDGSLDSNIATITVSITPVNFAPVAQSVGAPTAGVRFDAGSDELVRTTSLPPVTSFTMMGWFKLASDNHAYMTFLGLSQPTSSNAYLLMMCCGSGWRQLSVWTGSQFVMGPNLALNTWYHLALTVAGSGPGQVKAYLNGTLAFTLDGNPAVTADRFSIGNDSHVEWLDGSAAAVKVYDAVLTPTEIAAEMAVATPVRTANLNAWYPLQSAATATADGSGNGRTMTLAGTLTTDAAGPPVPSLTAVTTSEDTPLTSTLIATDINGDPLTFSIVTNGTKGTATITNASTGAYVYTPAPNANGTDSFTFKANDGRLDSNVATVTISITPVNDPPVASNGTASVLAGGTVTGTIIATDIDSPTLTYALVSNGAMGIATVNPTTGAYSYTANQNAGGTDTFRVKANDGSLDSNIATITVSITPVNFAPVAQSVGTPTAAVRFDASGDELVRTTNLPPITSFTMMGWFKLASDSHAYQTMLGLTHATSSDAYLLMTCCGNGAPQLSVWTGAQFVLGPNLALNTWYHVALVVSGSGPGQVKAYLNGTLAFTADGNPNVPSQRFSIGNDSHVEWMDGSAAAVKLYDAALTQSEIAAEMAVATPVRTTSLNAWYLLQSAATAAVDTSGNGRTMTVAGSLTTDAAGPPVPSLTAVTTAEDTPLNGTLIATDINGDPLTFSIVSNGAKGTATITNASTGAFIYTPNPNANGSDTFSFKANDGKLDSNVATVTISITPVNDPPVAVNGTAAVMAGSMVTGSAVATDIDSPTLTYALVTSGTKGIATINAATGAYTYTANAGASGTDTFQFKANDGSLDSNIATITVTITAVPPVNHPPVAVSQGAPVASVRFDAVGDELVRTTNLPPVTSFTMMGWFKLAASTGGYSTLLGLGPLSGNNAYLALTAGTSLGVWTGSGYASGPNLTIGTWYHIALTVSGTGPGQVQLYLNGVPTITLDGNAAVSSQRLSIANDSAHDWTNGSAAAVKIYDAVLTQAEIAAEMAQLAPVRTAGLNSSYDLQNAATAANDSSGNGRSMTVSGTLTTDSVGPPLPSASALTTHMNQPLSGTLQASDPDGDPLAFSAGTAPAHGTLAVNSNGSFTYTPSTGFTGSDSFTFVVSDGQLTATGTVYINVIP
jgi:hypothetical protein